MKEIWKKHKSEIIVGLIVTIVGGLILTAILSQQFREIAFKSIGKIQTEVNIPIYGLLIIFAFGVFLPLLFAWRTNNSINSYYKDEVFGLVWEWTDIPSHTGGSVFTTLCPICWTELPCFGDSRLYQCITCGFEKNTDYSRVDMLIRVEMEIDRRRRTGDWKQAKKRIKAVKNKS